MGRELWNSVALVIAVVVLAVGGPWLAREIASLPHGSLAARANQRIVALEIGGMTCSGCAAKVQSELVAVPGVTASDVRLKQRRAYVVCARTVPDSLLIGAVQRAGPGFLAAIATR